MIRYLGGKANIDAARNYYSELVNSGIKPNIDTFHYILYAITQGTKSLSSFFDFQVQSLTKLLRRV